MNYSNQKRIQRILDLWQPEYDKIGVKLTERDAIEIMDTLGGFFKILHRWHREEQERLKKELKRESQEVVSNGKLVNTQELAKILDVPVSWIYQRTRLGQDSIPHIKMGKYLRFKPAEVIDFFKSE